MVAHRWVPTNGGQLTGDVGSRTATYRPALAGFFHAQASACPVNAGIAETGGLHTMGAEVGPLQELACQFVRDSLLPAPHWRRCLPPFRLMQLRRLRTNCLSPAPGRSWAWRQPWALLCRVVDASRDGRANLIHTAPCRHASAGKAKSSTARQSFAATAPCMMPIAQSKPAPGGRRSAQPHTMGSPFAASCIDKSHGSTPVTAKRYVTRCLARRSWPPARGPIHGSAGLRSTRLQFPCPIHSTGHRLGHCAGCSSTDVEAQPRSAPAKFLLSSRLPHRKVVARSVLRNIHASIPQTWGHNRRGTE